jgi:hypothetical protein
MWEGQPASEDASPRKASPDASEEASRDDSATEGELSVPVKRNTENGNRAKARRGVPDVEDGTSEGPEDTELERVEPERGEFKGENGTGPVRNESD